MHRYPLNTNIKSRLIEYIGFTDSSKNNNTIVRFSFAQKPCKHNSGTLVYFHASNDSKKQHWMTKDTVTNKRNTQRMKKCHVLVRKQTHTIYVCIAFASVLVPEGPSPDAVSITRENTSNHLPFQLNTASPTSGYPYYLSWCD